MKPVRMIPSIIKIYRTVLFIQNPCNLSKILKFDPTESVKNRKVINTCE